MEPITQLADILQELSGVSSPSDAANYRFAQWHVDAVKASAGALAGDDRFWQRLAGRGVSMLSVAKSLGASMRDATAGKNMLSIPFFAFLLNLPGCPVSSLFDTLTLSGFLHGLKRGLLPAKAGGKDAAGKEAAEQAEGGGSDDEAVAANGNNDEASGPAQMHVDALQQLAAFLDGFSLKGSPDLLEMAVDAVTELIKALSAGGKPKEPRSKTPAVTTAVVEAGFALLDALIQPRHGDVLQLAASTFAKLVPVLVAGGGRAGKQSGGGGEGAKPLGVQFVAGVYQRNPAVREALAALARSLCLRAPDKADARAAATSAAVDIIALLPPEDLLALATFVLRLSLTSKVSQRLLALDVALSLLLDLPTPFAASVGYEGFMAAAVLAGPNGGAAAAAAPSPKQLALAPWSTLCLATLFQRCQDKAAGVRAKAVSNLGEVVDTFAALVAGGPGSEQYAMAEAFLHGLCGTPLLQLRVAKAAAPPPDEEAEGAADMEVDKAADGSPAGLAQGGGAAQGKSAAGRQPKAYDTYTAVMPLSLLLSLRPLLSLAHSRLRDDKAPVRRSALQLLEALLLLQGLLPPPLRRPPSQADILAVEAATADPLVSVRKAALGAALKLYQAFPEVASMAELWVRAALPLVRDTEAAVQEAVAEQFAAVVLDKVAAAGAGTGGGSSGSLAQVLPLLAAVADMGRAASTCIGKLAGLLAAKKRLKAKQVARGLEAVITSGHSSSSGGAGMEEEGVAGKEAQQRARQATLQGAWMLLQAVAAQDAGAPSWQFLQACWARLQQQPAQEGEGGGMMMSGEEGAQLLWVISHAAAGFPPGDAVKLAKDLLKAVLSFSLAPAAAAAHIAALHTLTTAAADGTNRGHQFKTAAEWGGAVMDAAQEVLARLVERHSSAALSEAQAHRAAVALFSLGEVALLKECRAGAKLVVLVQALTAPKLLPMEAPAANNANNDNGGGGGGVDVPCALQGHAWSCLGKLCVVNEALAKKCVPLLVQELGRSSSPVARNNILVTMADLCIHYTALVDGHMPRLAACIRDPHELVRRQALALLANLLMKDYVKWRGALFHRFLLALVDDSPAVCSLATYLLGDTLATKAPLLAYNHFVEALFVLNDCSAGLHAGRINATLGDVPSMAGGADGTAAELFSLRGSSGELRAKRDVVYTTLLRRMSPEHKFSTAAKLCTEVLAGVADGALPLPECDEVLGDALRLLACKEIKVSASRLAGGGGGAGGEDEAAGEGGGSGSQHPVMAEAAKAKGKIVSAMMKKHLVEGVVPVLIELKHMLQAQRHPLLGDLMACIAAVLKDYKNEVEDILVADKQLAREIVYDMKQAEAAAKAAAAAAAGGRGRPSGAAGLVLPAEAGELPPRPRSSGGSGAAAGGGKGKSKRPASAATVAVPGASPGTPLAVEVLLAEGAAAANGSGPSRRPQQLLPPPAAVGAAGSMKTPGGPGIMRSGSAAMKTPSTHGLAAKTPSTSGRPALSGAARVVATPAPLSASAKAGGGSGARGKENSGSGGSAGLAAGEEVTVHLPSPLQDHPQRLWNVRLDADGRPQGGGSKPPSRLRQQGPAAAAAPQNGGLAADMEMDGGGEGGGKEGAAAGGGGNGKQRGGGRPRGRAVKAAQLKAAEDPAEADASSEEADDHGEDGDYQAGKGKQRSRGGRGKAGAAKAAAAAVAGGGGRRKRAAAV